MCSNAKSCYWILITIIACCNTEIVSDNMDFMIDPVINADSEHQPGDDNNNFVELPQNGEQNLAPINDGNRLHATSENSSVVGTPFLIPSIMSQSFPETLAFTSFRAADPVAHLQHLQHKHIPHLYHHQPLFPLKYNRLHPLPQIPHSYLPPNSNLHPFHGRLPPITINKQHNTFLAPQTAQIAQTNGHNSELHQSQLNHLDTLLQRPYLIKVPQQRYVHFKRSTDYVKDETYRALERMMHLENEIMKRVNHVDNKKKRKKRAVPLLKLLMDPNKRLDVPKTLDNIGTITKQSFENQRSPMYHVRNMLGSAKDVFVSALKVPPQDLVIPSQYKIIDKKSKEYQDFLKSLEAEEDPLVQLSNSIPNNSTSNTTVGQESEVPNKKKLTLWERVRMNRLNRFKIKPRMASGRGDDNESTDFVSTFQKVGTAVRDSIKSGQETMKHMGDVAHSARKAFAATKFSAPTVLLPYSKAPALLSRSQFTENDYPDKMMIVAPRILQIEDDNNQRHPADLEENFVRVGDLTDALGVSPDDDRKINLTKLVIHHKMTPAPPTVQARFQSRSNLDSLAYEKGTRPSFLWTDLEDIYNADDEEIYDYEEELLESKPLQTFMEQIKDDFEALKTEVQVLRKQVNETREQQSTSNTNTNAKSTILGGSRVSLKDLLQKHTTKPKADDIGKPEDIKLPFEFLKTQKRDTRLEKFLEKLRQRKRGSTTTEQLTEEQMQQNIDHNLREIFGVVRPRMGEDIETEPVVGIGLALSPEMYKPFMGQPTEEQLIGFLEENHDDMSLLKDLENSDVVVEAINPVTYKKYFKEDLIQNPDADTEPATLQDMLLSDLLIKPNLQNDTGPAKNVSDSTNLISDEKDEKMKETIGIKNDKLWKPFMGKVDYDVIYDFRDTMAQKPVYPSDYQGLPYNKEHQYDYLDWDER